MPLSGENHTEVHQIVGSLIMRAFDLEQPGSRILDEDTVTVGCKRHVYPRQSSYLAGDLRQLDPTAELCRMAATHMADPAVIKGDLDRTPTPSPASAGETAAIVRGMLNAGVMTPKKRRVKPEGRRAVRGEDGVSWALPWGVYLVDPRRGEPSDRLKLRMLVRLSSGSCQVNGKAIGGAVSVRLERHEISKRTVLALR